MTVAHRLELGLAPALSIEEIVRFGPLTLAPFGRRRHRLSKIAERFAVKRGADPRGQAFVTCPENLHQLVPAIWSLFVFACTSYTRRELHSPRQISPEHFHLIPVTSSKLGFVFDTGETFGMGEAHHYPLRWPVDRPARLVEGLWDRRIELACRALGNHPTRHANNRLALAAGMAADLANASMERRTQKVENVAAGLRAFVLLACGFEALHCRGSDQDHTHAQVVRGVGRLDPGATTLCRHVFSKATIARHPVLEPGDVATRPMFVAARLVELRNTYAHGRRPPKDAFDLPGELNNAHVYPAALVLLAALLGDDLLRDLDCVVLRDTQGMFETEQRTGLPFELLHHAMRDGRELTTSLERMIVPRSERSAPRRSIEVRSWVEPLPKEDQRRTAKRPRGKHKDIP